MRIACLAALIIINHVLQATVFGSFAVLGVKPDTTVILIVCYGIMRGDAEGAVFGFFAGLAQDLFGGYFIGLFALLGMLIGYLSGKPFKDFFRDNYSLPFVPVVIATLCHQFLFYFTSFLFRGKTEFWYYAGTIILPKTIYTALLTVPLYALLLVLNARLERFEDIRRGVYKE
jgi:rod shape-determining protein MreD